MNDRFWEIVEQADEQGGDDPDIRDQVFAELLLEEVLRIVGNGGEFASRPKLIEQIKTHFGIEEE
jgi:hypothetical protein